MNPLSGLRQRLRALFRRSRLDDELGEEMRFHLDAQVQRNLEAGLSPREAREEARRQFGGVDQIKEYCRDEWSFDWLRQFAKDIQFAGRSLRKNPGFTITALVTLALGIGVNTTAFTLLNRLVLRPVPFADTHRLVQIWSTSPQGPSSAQTQGDYLDLRAQNTVFEAVAASYVSWMTSLAEPGQPATRCDSMGVTASFFPLLGIQPVMLGRPFTTEDETRHEHLVLLSQAFWLKHCGADPHVIGRSLRTDGAQSTIVGVMAPILDDPTLFGGSINNIDFYFLIADLDRNFRAFGWHSVTARLKPGVTIEQAQAEMTVLARRLAHDYPKTNKDRGLKIIAFPTNTVGAAGSRLIWLVMGLSGLVLLVACANLANLQLVRTTGRSQEFAIRLALGCSRSQLIRMLLTESVAISVAGGALGLLLALWSNRYLAAFWNVEMPLNLRVIGFTFVVSAATGAVFGTMPALFASRSDGNESMRSRARGSTPDRSRHRLNQALIVAELAVALTLLAGAGYFVRGIQRITHRDLGWRSENVLFAYLALDHEHYGEGGDPRSLAFGDRLRTELAGLPGVDAAALSNDTPVFGQNRVTGFAIEGKPAVGKDVSAFYDTPSPGYFKAYGIRLLQGRDFRDADRPGTPKVVIISQEMAERYWPGENPIGKRIGSGDATNQDWAEIVGVVDNITLGRESYPPPGRLAIYQPWAQNSFRFLAITLHCDRNPAALKEGLRKAVGRLEPNIAFSVLMTADEMRAYDLLQYSLTRRMLLQVAGLGLLLAAVGIYGVVANLASERTKEVGIRVALGAQFRDVIWLFLGNGVRLALIGSTLGLLGAFGLMQVLSHLIASFPGSDPWMVVGEALLLAAVALLACWLPARRATKIDPIAALKAE
jgi:putative ABC transport system permease protein